MLSILALVSKNYTNSRFDRLSRSQLSFGLYFSAPWCTQCAHSEIEIEVAANETYKVFEILKIDCSDAVQKEICIEYKAKKLPELHMLNFIPDKRHIKFDMEFTSKNI